MGAMSVTFIREYLDALANLLYPMHCAGCQKSLHDKGWWYLCSDCRDSISYITGRCCVRCGLELGDYAVASPDGCIECRGRRLRFDGAFSATYYEGVIKELIHRFKYGGQEFLIKPISEVLLRYAGRLQLGDIDVVVPVPLHRRRRLERGFNQAELLARVVARFLGLRVCVGTLRRVRNTVSQTELPYSRRADNVRGAFVVKRPGGFRNKNVLLVDDVLTSGFTASECARVLKEAGAGRVYVLTVAKSR